MKKTTIFILLAIMLAFIAAGCAPSASEPSSEPPKASESTAQTESATASEKKIVIGVSLGTVQDVFDRVLLTGINQFLDENKDKVETIVSEAKGDENTQLTNVDQLINSKVDILLLWPLAQDSLSSAVLKANEAGIPVVCVNTFTNEGEFVYVGSDDVDAGIIQGNWLIENIPQNAKYCYLVGPPGHSAQLGRRKGLEQTFIKERPDVTKLAEQIGEWKREKALSITEDWIKAFPDMNVIVSQNDNMILGSIEAARTVGKLKDIITVGVDATEEACIKIKEGELTMSVFQNAKLQGYKSMEVCLQIAQKTWNGGDKLIIPFEAVDKSNVDKYIEFYATTK